MSDTALRVLVVDDELAIRDIDGGGECIQSQLHPGGFQVCVGAVREALPRLHIAGEVVGDAADRVVRVRVRDNDRDVD